MHGSSTAKSTARPVKIAMACPGVGLVQRGFERMFSDLFDLVKDDIDVTLFKGGGPTSDNAINLRFIQRNGKFLKYFPFHKLLGRTTIHVECMTFAISLLLAIRSKEIGIIHCTDPPLARILYKLRKRFKLKFRLLYSEACAMPPSHYPPADHMHQISQITYSDALDDGIPVDYMTVIPLGFYPDKFRVNKSKSELRDQYGIPQDAFVILNLSALNRYHKRIDYLIDECSAVPDDFILWIDGSLDQGDPDLIQYAQNKLGEKCRVTHLPSKHVGELFAMADLMVHTASFEAFGIALVEGASTGLPVITHNAPHFHWLMNNDTCEINMNIKGNLSKKIQELIPRKDQLSDFDNSKEILKRFDWNCLKQQYLDLYSRVSELPEKDLARAHEFGLK
jgi:glycosyltransferase involved in cell wall biosynthesis